MKPIHAAALLILVLTAVGRAPVEPPRAPPPDSRPSPGQALAAELLYGGKLDLNRATIDDLAALPGIGRERAARIVRRRETRGPYRGVDELGEVSGIGPKTIERLRELVTPLVTPDGENRGPPPAPRSGG